MIQTSVTPLSVAAMVRRELHAIDPTAPEFRIVATLDAAVRDYVSPERFTTTLLAIFAATGVVLAAAGVYGVMRESPPAVRACRQARFADRVHAIVAQQQRIMHRAADSCSTRVRMEVGRVTVVDRLHQAKIAERTRLGRSQENAFPPATIGAMLDGV